MNVVLDVEPVRFPMTGIGRYAYELATGLRRSKEIENLVFVSCGKILNRLEKPESCKSGSARSKKELLIQALRCLPPLFSLAVECRRKQRERKLGRFEKYIFHGANFRLPRFSGKKVVTIHDLSLVRLPWCHPAERVKRLGKAMAKAVKEADCIVTLSEFSKREIVDYFHVSEEKIAVTYLAAASEFFQHSPEKQAPVLAKYGLSAGGYCFYAGTIEPRKNIDVLFDAYEKLPAELQREYPLILAGFSGWQSGALHKRIAEAEQKGWLRYLGFVSDEDLPFLFSGARLFLFPSLYEGFGLPPLEAMQSGTPVICSDSASLPEVVGKAGLLLDPHDANAWCEAISTGLTSETWRMEATNKGLTSAREFTWSRCVDETVEAYKRSLS